MPTAEEFFEHYVLRHRPVVIKRVAQSWPAFHRWTDDFLRANFSGRYTRLETSNDDKVLPWDNTKEINRNKIAARLQEEEEEEED